MRFSTRFHRTIASAAALGAALTFASAGSAFAANSPTTVTFSLTGGALSIAAPATAAATASSVSLTVPMTVGSTTVTDATGSLLGWTVTATATNLSGPGGASIPKANMTWLTGAVSVPSGQSGSLAGVASTGVGFGGPFLSAPVTGTDIPVLVAKALPLSGAGTYAYPASVTLAVPANTAAGDYVGTITQTLL